MIKRVDITQTPSIGLNLTTDSSHLALSRRYLDATRDTYRYHLLSQGVDHDRTTALGLLIKRNVKALYDEWHLGQIYGIADKSYSVEISSLYFTHACVDYYLNRYEFTDSSSLLNLWTHYVLPTVIPNKDNHPRLFIMNSGGVRYDLLQGPVTKNSQYMSQYSLSAADDVH